MGDSGAFLLGLMLAVSTSVVGGRADPNTQEFVGQTFFFFAPLVIPLLILGVPILDTVFAIIRRASKRQALDVADKGHLHHRLMNLGHGHRRSVMILWTWTALLSGFVLYPVLTDDNPRYLPFGIGALGDRAVHRAAPERAAASGRWRSRPRSSVRRPSRSIRRVRNDAKRTAPTRWAEGGPRARRRATRPTTVRPVGGRHPTNPRFRCSRSCHWTPTPTSLCLAFTNSVALVCDTVRTSAS